MTSHDLESRQRPNPERDARTHSATVVVGGEAVSPKALAVSVKNVEHHFPGHAGGEPVLVLNQVSLEIQRGEFTAFVGPSGCGKTTLLNMIANLLVPESGEIEILGRPCRGKPDRRVGYMFARDGLLPWRTAERNVMLGPVIRRQDKSSRRVAARALLADVGLTGYEQAYPAALSQGMRQRVAIARTLAVEPELILLDEPFAALDAHTRTKVQSQFTQLWERSASTVVMVTHDIVEALSLSDRVVVFSGRPGRIMADIPITWPRPRDIEEIRYTAEFAELSGQIADLLREHHAG